MGKKNSIDKLLISFAVIKKEYSIPQKQKNIELCS